MSLQSIAERLTLSSDEQYVLTKLRDFRRYGVAYVPLFLRDRGLCMICSLPSLSNIEGIFESWEHFSGNTMFPVPITEENCRNERAQYFKYPKYEGKQLDLRHSLAQHCIKELESLSKTRGLILLGLTLLSILTFSIALLT